MISVVDPEARHAQRLCTVARTGSKPTWRWSPRPGSRPRASSPRACGVDAADGATGIRLLAADDTLPPVSDGEVVEVLGDSAYATGDALKAIIEAGRVPLVKPGPLKPAVPGGVHD